jgi:hypothetical protein
MIDSKWIFMGSIWLIIFGLVVNPNAEAQLFDYEVVPYEYPDGEFIDGVKRVPPQMPPEAQQSGRCKFTIKLDERAFPKEVDIYYCTDFLFEEATIRSIEKWRFKPELANGTVKQVMTFRLTDESGKLIPEAQDAAFHKDYITDDAKDARLTHLLPPAGLGWEKLGEEIGHCCITHSVSQLGNTINVKIDSCSRKGLELTAEDVVRNWRYKSAQMRGKPVTVEGHQAVIKFLKITRRGHFLRDVNGLTPIAGVSEGELNYCRRVS